MDTLVLDIRSATCRGGGCLWAFLSHVREIPPGGAMELLTDDPVADRDIPEWALWEGWAVLEHERLPRYSRFLVQRPLQRDRPAPIVSGRAATSAHEPTG